ncbi:RDD family protein [Metabacillus herbersteinensis]|uniref:RDD family protein n=1 Tax=Metabacillus herbersteinensis TaxID=283816 RepID=A0ABV6G9E2_9BACI
MDTTLEGGNEFEQPLEKQHYSEVTTINHYAGFWMRFWAYLFDLLVVGSVNRIIIYPLFALMGINTSGAGIFSPIEIVTAITFFLYFVLMTKYFNQTLGKMIFGLKVVSVLKEKEPLPWSTVLFRELVGRYISKVIWIGYLIVAFTNKKQGLHDLFADTTVVHEKLYTVSRKEVKPVE